MKILNLDLDGVFADFETRFKEIVGFEYRENPKLAWSMLEKEDNLFLQLKPLPGAVEFFNTIYFNSEYEVRILTALPQLTGNLITAPSDKRAWVAKWLSADIQVICSNGWRDKKNFCKPGDILVDDMYRNIADWQNNDGIGVHHLDNRTTISQLQYLGVFR